MLQVYERGLQTVANQILDPSSQFKSQGSKADGQIRAFMEKNNLSFSIVIERAECVGNHD